MRLSNFPLSPNNYINEKKIKNKIREIENLIFELESFNELLEKDIGEIYDNIQDTEKLKRCLKVVYDIIININLFLEYKGISEKFLINIRNTEEINLKQKEYIFIELFYKQGIIKSSYVTDLESLKSQYGDGQFYSPSKNIIYTYPKKVSEQFTGIALKISKVFERLLPSYMAEVSDIGIYSEDMAQEEFLKSLDEKIKKEIDDIDFLILQISQFEENDFNMLSEYINDFIDIYKEILKTHLNIDPKIGENLIEIYINPSYFKNEMDLVNTQDIIKITTFDSNYYGLNHHVHIDKEHIIIQNNIICLKFKNGFDNERGFGSIYIELIKGFTINFFNAISDKIINILEVSDSINTLYNGKVYKIKFGNTIEFKGILTTEIIALRTNFIFSVLEKLGIVYNTDGEYIIIYENEDNTKEKLQSLISALSFNLEDIKD